MKQSPVKLKPNTPAAAILSKEPQYILSCLMHHSLYIRDINHIVIIIKPHRVRVLNSDTFCGSFAGLMLVSQYEKMPILHLDFRSCQDFLRIQRLTGDLKPEPRESTHTHPPTYTHTHTHTHTHTGHSYFVVVFAELLWRKRMKAPSVSKFKMKFLSRYSVLYVFL